VGHGSLPDSPSAARRTPGLRGGTRERHRTATRQGVARIPVKMHRMHMRRFLLTDEAKKKLWRPCREARALGL